MTRWAVGDVQGCDEELAQLLGMLRYSTDRDQIWFVGDLVNRGPRSLSALRRVRALGDNAVCVLGNHDLHLLAVALAGKKPRKHDTLGQVLEASDRDALIEWLLERPLAYHDASRGDLLLHAGVVPQWSVAQILQLAAEVQQALRADPKTLLERMYGDEPRRWRDTLAGVERLRFVINVLTRLRFCTAEGRVDFERKGKIDSELPPWQPWFRAPQRASAAAHIVFGHWSALGFYCGEGVLGLDTGCVWGGALSAINLDDPHAEPIAVASRQPRWQGD